MIMLNDLMQQHDKVSYAVGCVAGQILLAGQKFPVSFSVANG